MATVYGGIEGIEAPQYNIQLSYEENQAAEDAFVNEMAEQCRAQSDCPDAGKVISFPIADGKARYMVMDYEHLIHLALGDCWQIPDAHSRGLNEDDIKLKIKQQDAIAELFGRKKQ